MKVIAINGSPRKDGNTFHALDAIGEEIKAQGIDFEIIQVGHRMIRGCIACYKCAQNKDGKCSIDNDDLNKLIPEIKKADGIILASPVYYSGIAGTMKSFCDRYFFVNGSNGNFMRHKVGAAVVAVRRSGGSSALDGLNHYLSITEMVIATANYWNVVHGAVPGEVSQDGEGIQSMQVLGRNMAWLLKMKEETSKTIQPPEKAKKIVTNFIR